MVDVSSQIQAFFATHKILILAVAFVLGASFGSFINAVAMRTVAEKKWWGAERSSCDACGRALSSWDLIPVVSFLLLRGRCRYCGARIASRHLAAELLSAFLTAALLLRWGGSWALVLSLVLLWFSLFNSLTDLENGYIYDAMAVAPGLLGMALRVAGGGGALLDGLLGGALGFGLIAVIILLSRGGMGWGDAMLMLGIGALLGWRHCAVGLYLGFLVGGIVILPLFLAKKLTRKDAVPLGPFLAAGSVLGLFVGDAILLRLHALPILFPPYPVWPWW